MKTEGQVWLGVDISPETRKILEREACLLVYDAEDQLPLGRIVTAMILWFEEYNEWDEIRETIRADRAREAQERREREKKAESERIGADNALRRGD
jgi:hypothetical protein